MILKDLKKSISELPPKDAMLLIMERRASRRISKKPPQTKKTTSRTSGPPKTVMKVDVTQMFTQFNLTQQQELLKKLEAMKK
jgi:topoisomerase IA-like protein